MEVDVEGAVGSLAEGGFHGGVVAVGGPGAVDSEGGGLELEGDIYRSVGDVECVELCKGRACKQVLWDGVNAEVGQGVKVI